MRTARWSSADGLRAPWSRSRWPSRRRPKGSTYAWSSLSMARHASTSGVPLPRGSLSRSGSSRISRPGHEKRSSGTKRGVPGIAYFETSFSFIGSRWAINVVPQTLTRRRSARSSQRSTGRRSSARFWQPPMRPWPRTGARTTTELSLPTSARRANCWAVATWEEHGGRWRPDARYIGYRADIPGSCDHRRWKLWRRICDHSLRRAPRPRQTGSGSDSVCPNRADRREFENGQASQGQLA